MASRNRCTYRETGGTEPDRLPLADQPAAYLTTGGASQPGRSCRPQQAPLGSLAGVPVLAVDIAELDAPCQRLDDRAAVGHIAAGERLDEQVGGGPSGIGDDRSGVPWQRRGRHAQSPMR